MLDKGLIDVRTLHGIKVYQATEKKLNMLARLIQHFSRNILDTDTPLPAAAFVGSKMISEDEIDELDALLKQYADDGDTK